MYKKIIYLALLVIGSFGFSASFASSPHGISCTEMNYLLNNQKAILIDVREMGEYAYRRPKNALFLPIRQVVIGQFDSLIGAIDPSKPIIFYCDSGYYSNIVKQHFEKIFPGRDIVFIKGGVNNCLTSLPLIGDYKKVALPELMLGACGLIICIACGLSWKVSNKFLLIPIISGLILIIGSLFGWHDIINSVRAMFHIA